MVMSDLPNDLLVAIFSRIPVTYIGAVRSTCKNWNTLSYDQSFTKKLFGKTIATKDNEFLVVLMIYSKVYLTSVNLHEIQKIDDNKIKSSIVHKAKLTSLNDDVDYQVDIISKVFHCDGLLLCIIDEDIINFRFVVWNPCFGQTRRIKPRNAYQSCDKYAVGYEKRKDNSLRTHKILRFNYKSVGNHIINEFEIYNFNFDSWNVFYFTENWDILFFYRDVSINGNTYWFAREKYIEGPRISLPIFLICFEFTTERFGSRLRLPFHPCCKDIVILSSIREEQLAVLFDRLRTWKIEMWVTTKIEPQEASWNKLFLAVNITPLTLFELNGGSFFIDEKKSVVVV